MIPPQPIRATRGVGSHRRVLLIAAMLITTAEEPRGQSPRAQRSTDAEGLGHESASLPRGLGVLLILHITGGSPPRADHLGASAPTSYARPTSHMRGAAAAAAAPVPLLVLLAAPKERPGAGPGGQWCDPLHGAAARLAVGAAAFGSAAMDVAATLAVMGVAKYEVQEDQEGHPQGEEDEGELGGTVKGKTQGHLRNSEQRYSSAAPAVKVGPERAASNVLDQATSNGLEEDEDVYGHANAVVGVGQAPRRADGEEAEDEDHGGEPDGEN